MATSVSEVKDAKLAALKMAALDTGTKDKALKAMADAIVSNRQNILEANAADVAEAEGNVPSEILKMADFFNKYKDSQDMIFSLMQVWFRDLLILILEKDEQAVLTKDKTDILKKLALEYDADEVMRLFSSVERIREALRLGAQYAFSIDCLLKSMMEEL